VVSQPRPVPWVLDRLSLRTVLRKSSRRCCRAPAPQVVNLADDLLPCLGLLSVILPQLAPNLRLRLLVSVRIDKHVQRRFTYALRLPFLHCPLSQNPHRPLVAEEHRI
jgi:hypothetical protein